MHIFFSFLIFTPIVIATLESSKVRVKKIQSGDRFVSVTATRQRRPEAGVACFNFSFFAVIKIFVAFTKLNAEGLGSAANRRSH